MTKVLQVLHEDSTRTLVLYNRVQPSEVASLLAAIFNLPSSRAIVGFSTAQSANIISLSEACSNPDLLPSTVLLETQSLSSSTSSIPSRPSTAPSLGSKSPSKSSSVRHVSSSAQRPQTISRLAPGSFPIELIQHSLSLHLVEREPFSIAHSYDELIQMLAAHADAPTLVFVFSKRFV